MNIFKKLVIFLALIAFNSALFAEYRFFMGKNDTVTAQDKSGKRMKLADGAWKWINGKVVKGLEVQDALNKEYQVWLKEKESEEKESNKRKREQEEEQKNKKIKNKKIKNKKIKIEEEKSYFTPVYNVYSYVTSYVTSWFFNTQEKTKFEEEEKEERESEEETIINQEVKNPSGLNNFSGNNCYMNATIQCLVHCSHWLNAVNEIANKLDDKIEIDSLAGQFFQLLSALKDTDKKSISPKVFAEQAAEKFFKEKPGKKHQQQDSQEFLNFMLDELEGVKQVHNIALTSNRVCLRCTGLNTKTEDQNMLSLPVREQKEKMFFRDCWKEYFGKETLYSFCNHCLKQSDATISLKHTNSELFIVHLKRFNTLAKILTPVILCKTIKTNKCDYKLTGIVLHAGSKDFGHYIALVHKNNQWFVCNDATVTLDQDNAFITDLATVGKSTNKKYKNFTPYVLFYERL